MSSPTRPPLAPPSTTATPGGSTNPLQPDNDQVVVLYVVRYIEHGLIQVQTISMAVVIFGFWNVPGFRMLINPLKLFTIGLHELCHIILAIFSGGRILRVTIDPQIGGATIVEGGTPTLILSAGYLGSSILGGVFVLAAYHTLVAKIMSFVIGIGLLLPLSLVRDKVTIILTVLYEGLLIGFWFIDHGSALRWYCLFIGVMSSLFAIWDIADDRFFHKTNDSDATQFAILWPRLGPHLWASLWIFIQLGIIAAFSVIGLVAFKRTPEQMQAEAAVFLPT